MGGEDGAGSRKKEGKVTGAGRGLSEERVEDQVYASGGGQSGVRQSLPEQSLRHTGNNRCKPKKSHRKQCGGSGNSLQLALVEEGRALGGSRMPLGHEPGSEQPRSGRLEEGVCCKTRNTR